MGDGFDQLEDLGRPYGITWPYLIAWLVTWPIATAIFRLAIGVFVFCFLAVRSVVRYIIDCFCGPIFRLLAKIRRWKPLRVLPDAVDGRDFNAECPICSRMLILRKISASP